RSLLCSLCSALLSSASLIVQSHTRDKLPKTASRPVLSRFGLRPIRWPSLVLLHHNSSLIPHHSHPPRRQHQHLSSPPSTVHQSTVAGRHSFLSALFF